MMHGHTNIKINFSSVNLLVILICLYALFFRSLELINRLFNLIWTLFYFNPLQFFTF